jgi:hypothetical protein
MKNSGEQHDKDGQASSRASTFVKSDRNKRFGNKKK